jgi:hypothetical protein
MTTGVPSNTARLAPKRSSGYAFDDLEQFVEAITVAAGEHDELSSLLHDRSPFRRARHGDAPPAAEFEDPFVTQQSQRAEDCVGVHPRERQRGPSQGEAVARPRLAVCDRAADIAGNLLVEVGRIRSVDLDNTQTPCTPALAGGTPLRRVPSTRASTGEKAGTCSR